MPKPSNPMSNPEEIRRECLRYLAAVPVASIGMEHLLRVMHRSGLAEAKRCDVVHACQFLAGLAAPLVEVLHCPLGSSLLARVTSDGILFNERNP